MKLLDIFKRKEIKESTDVDTSNELTRLIASLLRATTDRSLGDYDRERVIDNAWDFYLTNPAAANYVNTETNLLVGGGVKISHTDDKVNEVLKDWIKSEDFYSYIEAGVKRWKIDAEVFTVLFYNVLTALVYLREVDPKEVKKVLYAPDDYKTVEGIYREYQETTYTAQGRQVVETPTNHTQLYDRFGNIHPSGEPQQMYKDDVPQMEGYNKVDVLFWKRQTVHNAKRGIAFLMPVMYWLRQLDAVMITIVNQVKLRIAYAWIVYMKGNPTQEELDAMQAAMDDRGAPTPGSVIVTSDNLEWDAKSPNINAGDLSTVTRDFALQIASGLSTPEFITTGDASNANYASTSVVMEAYKAKIAGERTQISRGFIEPILERWEEIQRMAGIFGETDGEFSIDFPDILQPDLVSLKGILEFAVGNNIISKEDALNAMPFDIEYDTAQQRIEDEKETEEKRGGGISAEHRPGFGEEGGEGGEPGL